LGESITKDLGCKDFTATAGASHVPDVQQQPRQRGVGRVAPLPSAPGERKLETIS